MSRITLSSELPNGRSVLVFLFVGLALLACAAWRQAALGSDRSGGRPAGLILAGVVEEGEEGEDGEEKKEGEGEQKEKERKEKAPKEEKPEAQAEKQEPEKKEPEAKPAEKPEKPQPAAEAEAKPAPARPSPRAVAEQPATPSQPARHKVKRELFKIEKTFSATLLPRGPVEIRMDSKAWSSFQVKEAVEHGAEVRPGDVLVRFDTEEIDRAIADQERAVRSTEQSLQDAERLLAIMEKTVPFDLTSAERALEIAKQDTQRYFSKERDLLIRNYELNLRAAQWSLEAAQEELRQLEKMYKADDLVEETEEFILKRQRQAVERAQFYYDMEKDRHERFFQWDLARRDEDAKRDLERIGYLTERTRINLPSLLVQQRLSVEQLRTDLERARDRLQKLKADRALFEIQAPTAGVVYYGQFTRGEWSGASMLQSKLRPGGSVSKGDVIFTLVQLPPQAVQFKVGEGDLRWMEVGREGTFKPAALPQLVLPAMVTQVDRVPVSSGQFTVVAELTLPKKPLPLVPTMTGTLRFLVYVKEDALVVPAKAVFSEELDPEQRYVYVVKGEGHEKRPVKVGEQAEDKVEILGGLKEGEEILLQKPPSDGQ